MDKVKKVDSSSEEKLLDFASHTMEEWRVAVDKLLKGKPYDKIMLTDTYEGIKLKPIYTQLDLENIPFIDDLPGEKSYVRSSLKYGYNDKEWLISQELRIPLSEEFNKTALKELNSGQNSLNVILDKATLNGLDPNQANSDQVGNSGLSLSCMNDLEIALKDVMLDSINLDFQAYSCALPIFSLYTSFAKKQNFDLIKLHGTIGSDPLSELAIEGSIPLSLEQAYTEMYHLTKWANKYTPNIRTISIHTDNYLNSGASTTEELAFAFSTAVEYIKRMLNKGLKIDEIAPNIAFHLGIGSNLFMEIAKFRAARIIWSRIIEEFGGQEKNKKMFIHARTSNFNKTRYDMHNNILRTATESFSAVMGSVDSICIGTFDQMIESNNDFSRRIARNQQLILKEECHFDNVIDPAGGSWYIESLTSEIVKETWQKFQKIESLGGMQQALITGKIEEMITSTLKKRKKNFFIRKDVQVGINMFANTLDKPEQKKSPDKTIYQSRIEKFRCNKSQDFALDTKAPVDSLISAFQKGFTIGNVVDKLREENDNWPIINPIKQIRLSQDFEQLRENMNSKTDKLPQVCLVNYGLIKDYKLRVEFSRGFFEAGGFIVSETEPVNSVNECVQKALDSQAEIVVLCSSDIKYPELVADFIRLYQDKNKKAQFVLAGYPKKYIEEFTKAGINHFIHVKANAYEILRTLQEVLGVSK